MTLGLGYCPLLPLGLLIFWLRAKSRRHIDRKIETERKTEREKEREMISRATI